MVYHILVASYSNDITTLAFDPSAATLEISSTITVGHHPSWITSHPSHPSLVWTGLEQSDGKILTLQHDENGKVSLVSEVSSAGRDPCHLFALKNELLFANYSSGTIGVLPINTVASAPVKCIQFNGSGPNKSRQEGSHPHQVVVHEGHDELLVPDLGADSVHRLKKSANGSWKLVGHIGYEAGGGPRHVAFYNGDIFTLLELKSKIVRHHFPALPALPTFVKSVPSMSNPPPEPTDMLAAEVVIPPKNSAFFTTYLYLSNRNDPSPEGDIISVFSIEEPDSLELVEEYRTGLNHLRGLVFGGPDDRYVIGGGANGGGVKVFERINGGRSFKVVASLDSVNAPTGFLWL